MAMEAKRFFLNLSVIIIAVGAFLLYSNISYNNSLKLVEATVIREYKPDAVSPLDHSSEKRHYFDIHPVYRYVFNGETYGEYDSVPIGMTYYDTRSLKLGDKVNFYVNDKGEVKYRESCRFPITLLVIGSLIFIVSKKAIKGYFNDFIVRYKKTHIFCIIYLAFYALFTYWVNENSGGPFDFGGSLVVWLLGTGVSIVLLAIVWIVSVVKYHSANK